MSSIHRISPEIAAALKAGRAIPFLVDYREPELADHTLTVIGLLDTQEFHGFLIRDDDHDGRLESKSFAACVPACVVHVPNVPLENPDARAVHALWAMWSSGARDDYLRYLQLLGVILRADRLLNVVEGFGDQEPAPEPPPQRRRSKSRRPQQEKRSRKEKRS